MNLQIGDIVMVNGKKAKIVAVNLAKPNPLKENWAYIVQLEGETESIRIKKSEVSHFSASTKDERDLEIA